MLNIDRHIAIWAGWVAGPAFGVAMMAAPEYLHFGPFWSGILFWGGIAVFVTTVIVVAALSLHEKRKQRALLGPVLIMAAGALIFCAGAAWYFLPKNEGSAGHDTTADLDRKISFNCYNSVAPTHFREDRPLHIV